MVWAGDARAQNFKRAYRATGNEIAVTLRAAGSGYALGAFGSFQTDGIVGRADATGNLLWLKNYPSSGQFTPGNIASTADAVWLVSSHPDDYNLYVAKFNAAGNLLFQKTLGLQHNGGLVRIAPAADGAIVSFTSYGAGATGVYVRLDAAGNVLWAKEIPNARIVGAVKTAGGFVLNAVSEGGSDRGFLLVSTNETGDALWSRRFDFDNEFWNGTVHTPAVLNDGSVVLTGIVATNTETGPVSGMALAKVSAAGAVLAQTGFAFPQTVNVENSGAWALEPVAAADGGLVAPFWYFQPQSGAFESLVLRLNASLSALSVKTVKTGLSEQEIYFCAARAADNGFAVGGTLAYFSQPGQPDSAKILINKTDANFVNGSNCGFSDAPAPTLLNANFVVTDPQIIAQNLTVTPSACAFAFNAVAATSQDLCGAGPQGCVPPHGLFAGTATLTGATVLWGQVSAANQYEIQYRKQGTNNWTTRTTTQTALALTGLDPGTTYELRARSKCGPGNSNNSAYSNIATFATLACTPATGFAANAAATTAYLSWNAVAGATGYRVIRRPASGGTWTAVNATTNAYEITGLTPNTLYRVGVIVRCTPAILSDTVFAVISTVAAGDELWKRDATGALTPTFPDSRVGIGTENPAARLHVAGNALLGTSGAGAKVLWNQEKGAFRAGSVSGNQWDPANLGQNSIALGENVMATGENSIAIGKGVTAGAKSIVIGFESAQPNTESVIQFRVGNGSQGEGTALQRFVRSYAPCNVLMPPRPICKTINFPHPVLDLTHYGDVEILQSLVPMTDGVHNGGNLRVRNQIKAHSLDVRTHIGIGVDDPNLQGGSRAVYFSSGYNFNDDFGDTERKLHIASDPTASNPPAVTVAFNLGVPTVGIANRNPLHLFQVSNTDFVVTASGNIGVANAAPNRRLTVGMHDFVVTSDGNVGIGTADPTARFHVEGDAKVNGLLCAREVRVKLTGAPCWPDYVFEKDYELTSLDEVKAFVETHKHLPGVPSSADVENNGVDLGANQAQLLLKIEELYLHLFELKAELERCKGPSETRK